MYIVDFLAWGRVCSGRGEVADSLSIVRLYVVMVFLGIRGGVIGRLVFCLLLEFVVYEFIFDYRDFNIVI